MATEQWNSVVRHLRRAAFLQESGDLTDGRLLEGFIARRDAAAFASPGGNWCRGKLVSLHVLTVEA